MKLAMTVRYDPDSGDATLVFDHEFRCESEETQMSVIVHVLEVLVPICEIAEAEREVSGARGH